MESVRELGGILSNMSMSVCRVAAMPLSTRDAGCSQHVGAVLHRARTRLRHGTRTKAARRGAERAQRDPRDASRKVSGIGSPRWGGSNGGGVRVESRA